MLKTIIKKEIMEVFFSYRFIIATFITILIIPLGVYVNLKEYEQRLEDYQKAQELYLKNSEGYVSDFFQIAAYRPPSPMGIFAIGIEQVLPNKILTSREGMIQKFYEQGTTNLQSSLLGKVDFVFNITFFLSILAFVFTYSRISGEKEQGTLRGMISNPILRWKVFLGKVIGNYIILLIPFIISVLLSLVILNTSGSVSFLSTNIILPFLSIFAITLLFLLSMVLLGMLISTLTHSSASSIISLILVWTVVVLFIPKISPMIAEIVRPVKSKQVYELEQTLIRQNYDTELDKERRKLYNRIASQYNMDPYNAHFKAKNDSTAKHVHNLYLENAKALEETYEKKTALGIINIDQEYKNALNIQSTIANTLSRLSPISCYYYAISEIAATGTLEMEIFDNQAKQFQQFVKETFYDNMIKKTYNVGEGEATVIIWDYKGDFNPKNYKIPILQYRHTTLNEALNEEMIDIFLLIIFNLLFFVVGFLCFQRYDVR